MGELNGKVKVVRDHISLDKDSQQALKGFIGLVYLMRQAQKTYKVIPEGKYLIKKMRFEAEVDAYLKLLIKQ